MRLSAVLLMAFVSLLVGSLSVCADPLPVVLWHGMGDTCCNPLSMGRIKEQIVNETGAYVYSVRIGNNEVEDQFNGFFKNVNDQVSMVCRALKEDPQLAGGFNALGFSQGGQFLRAYVQRCNDPPVHNLITFGGQHQGVFGLPRCEALNHTLCEWMREALDLGAYEKLVQDHVVQAEYWQDPNKYQEYLAKNIFLPDINNNKEVKNSLYKSRLQSLNKFVMVKFTEDSMVQPRESEWFGFYAPGQDKVVLSLQQTELYQQDWLGLKAMDEQGQLVFLAVDGDHLRFSDQWFSNEIIQVYL